MNQEQYLANKSVRIKKETEIHYKPSKGLKEAVNVALLTERPLLVMGEPGTGKSLLAKAVASEWYGHELEGRYFEWGIKSKTEAEEGLYRYDAIRRLNDAQVLEGEKRERINRMGLDFAPDSDAYIQAGELSKAIHSSTKGRRTVLLIDEIDKADIDFPNDLLEIIEKQVFTIKETGEKVSPPDDFVMPLIIVTSNREKELPPAFLRRCLYFFIEFPQEKELLEIIAGHYGNIKTDEIETALKVFVEIRKHFDGRLRASEKKIGTSELVDWFGLLDALRKKEGALTDNEAQLLNKFEGWFEKTKAKEKMSLSEIAQIPFYQLLFKNIESREFFLKQHR